MDEQPDPETGTALSLAGWLGHTQHRHTVALLGADEDSAVSVVASPIITSKVKMVG